ncbi:MAG: hypothetical protein MMC23_004425 [Stictis urceolatum]|nr:hypothetical protein [Stictis urceolata]
MSKDHPEQGPYSSAHWTNQSREQYPPPPQQGSYPAPSPYSQQSPHAPANSSDMLTLPPPSQMPQQDPYRDHPPQYDMYQGQPGQMPYPTGPHPNSQQQPVSFAQPAPRQRTAIACRYCRRRKIRCHGFDSQPDGRCTNCVRFHQECIFTPVSSQAHAFVPAHTAYPHLRNTGRGDGRQVYPQGQQPVIYGAHGQPLGPVGAQGHDSTYPPPPGPGQAYAPGPYPGYDDRGQPPPDARGGPARRSSGAAYEYPDPTHMAPVSPASSATSYQSAPYPPQGSQPYYPAQHPPRRTSPQSGYPNEAPGGAGSPPGSSSSGSGFPAYPGGLHPPQVLPPTYEAARTPPPSSQSREGTAATNGSRPGMTVRDMLGPGDGQGARSNTDSDMLKALNRRGM